jgi:hypothetical protein
MPVGVLAFVVAVLITLSNPSVNHGVGVRRDSVHLVIGRFGS